MEDKEEILADLGRLETTLADTYALVGTIRDSLSQAISDNIKLDQENEKLRARLVELEQAESPKNANNSLMELYDEGYHVCHQYYGKVLENGENCLLCQEVLYR